MFNVYKMSYSKLKAGDNFLFMMTKRFKNPDHHWSVKRKKLFNTDRAMKHFDEFYGTTFGEQWKAIRVAILRKQKYVAVVNNFGDDKDTIHHLYSIGARSLQDFYDERKDIAERELESISTTDDQAVVSTDSRIKGFAEQISRKEIESIYDTGKDSIEPPQMLEIGETTIGKEILHNDDAFKEPQESSAHKASLSSGMNKAEMDISRIIQPELGMTAAALWTYVPATKIKGREDWLPESHQFQYYSSAEDFPLTIEEDETFNIPENLKVFSFEKNNTATFREPKQSVTGVYNYYLMDGASVLPVLALGLQAGDRVLDMCAAPGGKSLLVLQTMLADVLVANDSSYSRIKRINKVFKEYLYDYKSSNKWTERVIVSQMDGRDLKDEEGYDKVLIDVPCTTDRHSLKEDDNNLFKVSRIKERLRLPEIQTGLLCNALKLCRVGGTVVYSTCSLSPIQNDGVVHMALKKAFLNYGIKATIKLTTKAIRPLRGLYYLGEGSTAARYGQLIVPHISANFGPSYFSKLVRTQ